MVSNLSTIGFVYDDPEAFRAAMVRLANAAAARLATPAGDYAIWRSQSGAELWFHLAPASAGGEREVIGLTPFFDGRSAVQVEHTDSYVRPDDNALEGAFHAWVAPDDDGAGAYPLVYDAVDFAARSAQELPFTHAVRIVGFARELKAFPSAEAYLAAPDRQPPLAAEAFIPMGLFAAAAADPDDELREAPPSSTAILTGRVAAHQLLVNEETGRRFHWLLVETLAATFDCLADPEIVAGTIALGGTVEVACLLFGRSLDDDELAASA